MNPDGTELRRFEAELQATVQDAFNRLQSDLFGGIDDSTVFTVIMRLNMESVIKPFRDSIVRGLQRIALAGSEFGREQVEGEVFGVKHVR